MRHQPALLKLVLVPFLLLCAAHAALAQTTAFTYHGRLADEGAPASGNYELEFKLYDAPTGGTQQPQPSPVTVQFTGAQAVAVAGGVFTVQLDFGADAFPGAARYLEVGVRRAGDSSFTTLSPRQPITSTPYAIRSSEAATAAGFTGSLAGDVTGTQSATVVASVGGASAADVAGGAAAANAATNDNTAGAIVRRDASGNFSAGTITATLNGNASTATNATNATNATTAAGVTTAAGDSVVAAINASSSTVNAARLPSTLATQNGTNTFSGTNTFTTAPSFSAGLSAGGQRVTNVATPTATSDAANKAYVDSAVGGAPFVQLAPSSQQTTSSTNTLINLGLDGAGTLGSPGVNSLLNLTAAGTYPDGQTHTSHGHLFRVDNSGNILAVGHYDAGITPGPIQSSSTGGEFAQSRFVWYPGKSAIRAGYVNGTQWDDANIGLFSTAFGGNVRASGDYGVALGNNAVAANTGGVAIGNNIYNIAAYSVVLGWGATSQTTGDAPRQGSFVFTDNSVPYCDGSAGGGCGADTRFRISANRSFNARATGGFWLWTNSGATTGLRMSIESTSSNEFGSFVYTDRSSDTAVTPTAQHSAIFRTSGGFTIYTNSGLTSGVTVSAGGGAWNSVSDRNMKANFAAVNPREILRGVLSLPISTWNYRTQDASVRHIGPTAQDFFNTFKVGDGDKTISTVDPDGVALAAIQGLHEEIKDRDVKIDRLQEQLRQQQTQIDALKKLLCLDRPEAEVCKEGR